MWSLARCDARTDCKREGEEGKDKCDESLRAENAGGVTKYTPINVGSLVVFVFVFFACLMSDLLFH